MNDKHSKPDASDDESDKPLDTQFTNISIFDNWRLSLRSTSWRPPTDVYEVDDDLIVRVEIAGMREEDFSIELNGRILSIRGMRNKYGLSTTKASCVCNSRKLNLGR